MKSYITIRFLAFTMLVQCVAYSQAELEIKQAAGTDRIQFLVAKADNHRLEIDDADGFHTPVVTKDFHGATLELRTNDTGLIPGIPYHLRLDGKRIKQDLRLQQVVQLGPEANCKILHHTWEVTGRLDVGKASSGLDWAGDHWVIVPHTYLLGEYLYNMAIVMGPAIEAARACGDNKTLDEMAQYYLIMLRQTDTVGEVLKRPNVDTDSINRLSVTDHAARTISALFGTETGEGELYNAQWLHPAALLLRVITLLPESSRTSAMKEFCSQYSRFIVKEQLLRYLFEQRMPRLGGISIQGRVASWKAVMRGLKGGDSWDTAMSDIDLWLLASAAEMLGAHANDPQLVQIDEQSLSQLHTAIATGLQFFHSKRTLYSDTKNYKSEVVGSASYFNGDYAAHSDMAYSAVGGEKFPTRAERRSNPNASWDISHAYRLPIFLRALYENRKALKTEQGIQIRYEDLQQVVNQYIYRVFTGDYSRPQFRNFLDGGDGWMRVDYNGAGFGHPPSDFCDMHNSMRPCLMPGEILGWGELAFVNPDLARLERSLVELAFANAPTVVMFRDKHFFWNAPYRINTIKGGPLYEGALYLVVAENADQIADANKY